MFRKIVCSFIVFASFASPLLASDVVFEYSQDRLILEVARHIVGFSHSDSEYAAWQDVNDDGQKELFLFDEGGECVEHVCATYILQKQEDEWAIIFKALTNTAIGVLPETQETYHAIAVRITSDTHIFQPHTRTYEWDGKSYVLTGVQSLKK
jgi:hypothetical protein